MVTIKENQLEKVLDPRSWFKDTSAKKCCFREQFFKTPSETALFCKSFHKSTVVLFQLKQNLERNIYSKQTFCTIYTFIWNKTKQNRDEFILTKDQLWTVRRTGQNWQSWKETLSYLNIFKTHLLLKHHFSAWISWCSISNK